VEAATAAKGAAVTTNHADFDGPGSRAHRRTARAALAATIVLVLGGGALLAACGSEYADPAVSSDDSPFLLPPEGVDVQSASGSYGNPADAEPDPEQLNAYLISWKDSSGADVTLGVGRQGAITGGRTPWTVDFEAPTDVDELIAIADRSWGGSWKLADAMRLEVDAGPLDPVVSLCLSTSDDSGIPIVVGSAGRSLAFIDVPRPIQAPCEEVLDDSPALRASQDLRVVDEATWRAFMDEWGEITPATTTTASTTTTLDPSLVDYCDAVARFTSAGVMDPDSGVVGPDGVPYLEDIRDVAPPELRASYDAFISWVQAGSPEPAPEGVGAAGLAMTRDYLGTCQGTVS
jgi:hypothetical protein